MRSLLVAGVIGLIASQALAAPGDGKKPDRQPNPERMQKILEKFDADGDGKLNAEERQAARQAREARQGNRPKQGQGKPGQARRPGGQAQAGGPMRDPAAMFKQADTDGNGQLSQQEFMGLMQKMRQGRQQAGNAGRGPEARERGPRGDRAGRPEGRRRPATEQPASDEVE
jgi:hypothetical protein